MRGADMLDHADADHPIKRALDVAVVGQLELDLVGHARSLRPLVRELDLIGCERNAQYLAAEMAVEIESEPAPAAADIEQAHARLQPQLGGDQGLLVDLRAFQRVRRILEIGHGILPVLVEEQLVELAGQVIVMDHVLAGLDPQVDLVGLGEDPVDPALQGIWRADPAATVGIHHHQQDHVADIVRRLHHQPPVHIGFARTDPGIPGDMQGRALVGKADRHRIGGKVPIAIFAAIVIDDAQLAFLDQRGKHLVE